jgi:hypothetical protein
MTRRELFWTIIAAGTASLLLAGAVAYATNTTFILGSTANSPDALTAATAQNKDSHGGLSGAMIQLTNHSTSSAGTALGLTAGAGRPPFTTNSSARVANLNADRLDGTSAAGFASGGGRLFNARVVVNPGLSFQTAFDHSTSVPNFRVDYECTDPNGAGSIRLVNTSPTAVADIFGREGRSVSDTTVGTGGSLTLNTVNTGTGAEFNAGWYDGHRLTLWVFTHHTPDACVVHLTARTS